VTSQKSEDLISEVLSLKTNRPGSGEDHAPSVSGLEHYRSLKIPLRDVWYRSKYVCINDDEMVEA
jgi:hypothetical protein